MNESLSSICDQIEELFGVRELPRDAGVLHVTALSQHPDQLRTIAIDAHSPQSARDHFALMLGRARADAIIITGKLLRDEPNYAIALPAGDGLRTWRKSVMQRDRDPELWVMTRSGEVDAGHPIWTSEVRPVVFTTPAGGARLQQTLPDVERVEVDEPSLAKAIEAAQSRGSTTIVLEAGPSTTDAAYRDRLVDELMLSRFYGPFDPQMNETRAPFTDAELETVLPLAGPRREHEETSGRWSFQRRWRSGNESL